MRIHHLNCGTLRGQFPRIDSMIYCLLVESDRGLILIDTGVGRQDYSSPSRRMRLFARWVGLLGDVKETAAHQIEALGYASSDVSDIVLTHLHLDHAGGLRDFPEADVHIFQAEYEAGMRPRRPMEWAYDPSQYAHGPKWVVHSDLREPWYGFASLPIWDGREPQILLIPLPGHTRGHCGVAIQTDNGWLLQCGDAVSPFHPASDVHGLDTSQYTATILPAWFVERFLGSHARRIRAVLERHPGEVEAVSSHDLYSFRRYVARS